MAKAKNRRNGKIFYIDTNIVLDYITKRNSGTVLLLDKIKEKRWTCISSSFLVMELADYKKDYLFLENKLQEKWEIRKITRQTYQKDLSKKHFEVVKEWFADFWGKYENFELYDFLINTDNWLLAQRIVLYSNLYAPDAIHLASAIIGAVNNQCQTFITNDKFFTREATKFLQANKLMKKLHILTVAEVSHKYFS